MNPHAINIFTDGSAIPNPGISGEGIVIIYPDNVVREIIPDGYKVSTNNRTELRACVDALKELQKDPKAEKIDYVCIYSDSQYVVDNYRNVTLGIWQKRKWKKVDGNDVDNRDYWQDFERECRKIRKRVEIFKVKAHSGNQFNETADRLADKSRARPLRTDFHMKRSQVRRWLKIPVKTGEINLNNVFIVCIIVTNPRTENYEAKVQILRPKKYLGYRITLIGSIKTQPLNASHVYKVKIENVKGSYELTEIIEDLGRSNDNKNLQVA